MDQQANERSRLVTFYLVENFSMMAFTSAIEPLRLANRQVGKDLYRWRLVSAEQHSVTASNGVGITTDSTLEEEKRRPISFDEKSKLVLVCAGVNVSQYVSKPLKSWLRDLHVHGVTIGGLCTGAWILASADLLNNRRCAIHWENLPGFSEAFPKAEVYADLFEFDGNVYSCAGGAAALDMMLHIIADDHGDELANQVSEQCLVDRIRNSQDRQRLPLRARLGINNSRLIYIIELMEANIAQTIPLTDIADSIGLSRRQIERLFAKNLGRSPSRYYLEIRLERARHLLIQTDLPIVEVAVACGFVSASHFSKCYRELYGRSPQMERSNRDSLVEPA